MNNEQKLVMEHMLKAMSYHYQAIWGDVYNKFLKCVDFSLRMTAQI